MEPKDLLSFYEKHYFHEINEREKFNTRLQIPIAIFVAEFAIISAMLRTTAVTLSDLLAGTAFAVICVASGIFLRSILRMFKEEDYDTLFNKTFPTCLISLGFTFIIADLFPHHSSLLGLHMYGYLILATVFLLVGVYYISRAATGYKYEYLPLLSDTDKFYQDLRITYEQIEEFKHLVGQNMHDYLSESYVCCASINAQHNAVRSFYFHRVYRYLTYSFILLFMSASPYYLGKVNINSDVVQKINIEKIPNGYGGNKNGK